MGGQGWQLPTQVLTDQLTPSQTEGAACLGIQMDFTRTFETTTKRNNMNHV